MNGGLCGGDGRRRHCATGSWWPMKETAFVFQAVLPAWRRRLLDVHRFPGRPRIETSHQGAARACGASPSKPLHVQRVPLQRPTRQSRVSGSGAWPALLRPRGSMFGKVVWARSCRRESKLRELAGPCGPVCREELSGATGVLQQVMREQKCRSKGAWPRGSPSRGAGAASTSVFYVEKPTRIL